MRSRRAGRLTTDLIATKGDWHGPGAGTAAPGFNGACGPLAEARARGVSAVTYGAAPGTVRFVALLPDGVPTVRLEVEGKPARTVRVRANVVVAPLAGPGTGSFSGPAGAQRVAIVSGVLDDA